MSQSSTEGDSRIHISLHAHSAIRKRINPSVSQPAPTVQAVGVPLTDAAGEEREVPAASPRSRKGLLSTTSTLHNDDEPQVISPGDLVNSIGSASSLSSTASSIFSGNLPTMPAYGAGASGPPSLTPITNTESSPPAKTLSPRAAKRTYDQMQNGTSPYPAHDASSQNATSTITPIQTPPDPPKQARPGLKEVKGVKCTYDPEIDDKLSSADRKRYKARYKAFGAEVRSTSIGLFYHSSLHNWARFADRSACRTNPRHHQILAWQLPAIQKVPITDLESRARPKSVLRPSLLAHITLIPAYP